MGGGASAGGRTAQPQCSIEATFPDDGLGCPVIGVGHAVPIRRPPLGLSRVEDCAGACPLELVRAGRRARHGLQHTLLCCCLLRESRLKQRVRECPVDSGWARTRMARLGASTVAGWFDTFVQTRSGVAKVLFHEQIASILL